MTNRLVCHLYKLFSGDCFVVFTLGFVERGRRPDSQSREPGFESSTLLWVSEWTGLTGGKL